MMITTTGRTDISRASWATLSRKAQSPTNGSFYKLSIVVAVNCDKIASTSSYSLCRYVQYQALRGFLRKHIDTSAKILIVGTYVSSVSIVDAAVTGM